MSFVFTIASDDEADGPTSAAAKKPQRATAKGRPSAAAAATAAAAAADPALPDDDKSDDESEFETLASAAAAAQRVQQKRNQHTNSQNTGKGQAPAAAVAGHKRKRAADADADAGAEDDDEDDGASSAAAAAAADGSVPSSLFDFEADDEDDAVASGSSAGARIESWEEQMRRDTRLREAALRGNTTGTDLATKIAAQLQHRNKTRRKTAGAVAAAAAGDADDSGSDDDIRALAAESDAGDAKGSGAAAAADDGVDEFGVPIEDGGEVTLDPNSVVSGSDDDDDDEVDVPEGIDLDADGNDQDADADADDADAKGEDDAEADGSDAEAAADADAEAKDADGDVQVSNADAPAAAAAAEAAPKAKAKAPKVVSAAFQPQDSDGVIDFSDLKLSRQLLRACKELGFVHPTPVQRQTIPHALMGADLLVNAVTGSGKTAAFMLPILERFVGKQQMYRVRHEATSVLVLTPTRELAAQCHAMSSALAKHVNGVKFCLVVGGLSSQVQATALLHNPDIIIATPGRIIDHIRNTRTFNLDGIQVLVLDEADRLLEETFNDEVREVVKACPRQRQTMLFSATLSDQVKDLVNLSLNKPVKITLSSHLATVDSLEQEFVRIRKKGNEDTKADREAIVLALCRRTFKSKVIIFAQTKVDAHRLMIIFLMCKLKAAELHGNLTQSQRLDAVEQFRAGKADFLICTDLAARGIDIKGVETVINLSLPRQLSQYVHRVGRTARAGRAGRSITLVDETQRKQLKDIVRQAKEVVKSRAVPQPVLARYKQAIANLETDIEAIIKQEKYEKYLRMTQTEADAALNKITHQKEIMSRPAKTWFQTPKEKAAAKTSGQRIVESTDDERNAIVAAQAERAAKLADGKGAGAKAKKEKKEKDKKKDPLEGLSRQKKRRKMLALEDAKEEAAERAAAEAEGKKFVSMAARQRAAVRADKQSRHKTRREMDGESGNAPSKAGKKQLLARAGGNASSTANRYNTGSMYDSLNPESGFYADSRYRDNNRNARAMNAQLNRLEAKGARAAELSAQGKSKTKVAGRKAFKSKARHKRRG